MERLLPVFLGRHADVGLKHFVEGGHGAEPDVGGDALERDVGLRVAQQADGLVEPVAVDVLGECLARLLVDDLGEVGAVRAQQVGHFFLGQQFVPVDALVRHAMFQVLEEHVLLFVGQGQCLLQERDGFVVPPFPAERVRIAVEQEHLDRRLVRPRPFPALCETA